MTTVGDQQFEVEMRRNPRDQYARLLYADWLESEGRNEDAMFIRCLHKLATEKVKRVSDRRALENQLRQLALSRQFRPGPFWTNCIGMKFAWVQDDLHYPAGGFWLGVYPVTQAQYLRVKKNNPSFFNKEGVDLNGYPVDGVRWGDCYEFIHWLELLDKYNRYELPTPSEWVTACSGGIHCSDYWFRDYPFKYANVYTGIPHNNTTPVDKYPANPFGIKDMIGNVWEWCKTEPNETMWRPIMGPSWAYPAMAPKAQLNRSLGQGNSANTHVLSADIGFRIKLVNIIPTVVDKDQKPC